MPKREVVLKRIRIEEGPFKCVIETEDNKFPPSITIALDSGGRMELAFPTSQLDRLKALVDLIVEARDS